MLSLMMQMQESTVVATVGEFFDAGGVLMWPILGCSVVVVGLALERYLSLRKARVLPRVVGDAAEQVRDGRAEVIEAGILEAKAPAARVLAAGLRRRGRKLAEQGADVNAALTSTGARIVGMSAGIPLVSLVIEPVPDEKALLARAEEVQSTSAFLLVLPGRSAGTGATSSSR